MKAKLFLSGLWVIASLIAMWFEPVNLADIGIGAYTAYYVFFAVNAGIAASITGEQIEKCLRNKLTKPR
jgi:hypothetical protein